MPRTITISQRQFLNHYEEILDIVEFENWSFLIVDPLNNNLKIAILMPAKPYLDLKKTLENMEDDHK
jgi:hypothetical protein